MKRDSFVFRGEWKDALSGLSDSVRLEVYEAVIEYGCSGTLPTLKPMAMLAFNFMRTAIDKDQERYDAVARERSERARRNASARWNAKYAEACDGIDECNCMQPHANDATACNCMQPHEEMQPHENDAIYDSVYVSDNVIEEKEPKGSKKKAAEAAAIKIKEAAKKLTDEVYATSYSDRIKFAFCNYWLEPNPSKTKLRYQLEKTWDTERRLATWAAREKPQDRKGDDIILRDNSTEKYNQDEERWNR